MNKFKKGDRVYFGGSLGPQALQLYPDLRGQTFTVIRVVEGIVYVEYRPGKVDGWNYAVFAKAPLESKADLEALYE